MNVYDYFYGNGLKGYMVDYHGELWDCTDSGGSTNRVVAITMASTVLYRYSRVLEEHRIVPVLFAAKEEAEIFARDLRASIALNATAAEFVNAGIPLDRLRPIGKLLRNRLLDNPHVVEALHGRSPEVYDSFSRYVSTKLLDYVFDEDR